jgi:MYXO-CTERM domain-containing protein
MKPITNTLRIGALMVALVSGPMFAQTSTAPQTVPTTGGPQSGSPGSEIPNDVAAAPNPQANSTYQQDKDGDMGINLGWLGLLGLAGLFGLRRGVTSDRTS